MDERSIMAEIMRKNILAEKVAKASSWDKKRQELLRKREQLLMEERARQIQKMRGANPGPEERERRLRALAEKTKELRQLTKQNDKENL